MHNKSLPPTAESSGLSEESKLEYEARPFPCTKCEKKFKNVHHLKDHAFIIHDNNFFECSFKCGFKARSRHTVKRHKENKHPGVSKKVIKKGNRSRSKNYKKSLKRAIQVSNIKVKKDSQAKVESVKNSLMRKLMKRCKLCDKDIRARDVNYHMKKKHFTTNPKEIQDNIVEIGSSKVITNKLPIKATTVRDDKNLDPLKCDHCEATFSSPANKQRHINGVHLGIKTACDYCEKEFSQESNLKAHIDTAHDKRRQECAICPFKTITSSKLQDHIQNEHQGKPEEGSSSLPKKIPGPPPGPKIVSVEGSVLSSAETLQEPSLPGEKLLTEEDDVMSGIVEFQFILEQDEFYCDLCMFETQDEKRLENHLMMNHYNEVYGR